MAFGRARGGGGRGGLDFIGGRIGVAADALSSSVVNANVDIVRLTLTMLVGTGVKVSAACATGRSWTCQGGAGASSFSNGGEDGGGGSTAFGSPRGGGGRGGLDLGVIRAVVVEAVATLILDGGGEGCL